MNGLNASIITLWAVQFPSPVTRVTSQESLPSPTSRFLKLWLLLCHLSFLIFRQNQSHLKHILEYIFNFNDVILCTSFQCLLNSNLLVVFGGLVVTLPAIKLFSLMGPLLMYNGTPVITCTAFIHFKIYSLWVHKCISIDVS